VPTMFELFDSPAAPSAQTQLDFPIPLTERYRPRAMADFVGLAKPKLLCAKLAARPFASAWLFTGPSGTGKTTMGIALGEMIPAEMHHIPSQECDLATLERVCRTCARVPWMGKKMHLVLVDEADQMSPAAQLFLLSKLDSTAQLSNVIWVFTCNSTDRLQDRFLSRVKQVEFSSYGIAAETAAMLQKIWDENTTAAAPNFARIVKESNNNVRESLMKLELELMLAN
jgi:replication-associated recombination protein RarA